MLAFTGGCGGWLEGSMMGPTTPDFCGDQIRGILIVLVIKHRCVEGNGRHMGGNGRQWEAMEGNGRQWKAWKALEGISLGDLRGGGLAPHAEGIRVFSSSAHPVRA